MKPILTGLDLMEIQDEIEIDDLERLMGEIEMLKHLKKDYRELILCNLREEYSELWNRLKRMKDNSTHAKMCYFQLLPYFQSINLEAIISSQFDSQIVKNGWIPGQLYVISGLSGGGKTSLAIMISVVLISGLNPLFPEKGRQKQAKVLYVNLEQVTEELEKRAISLFSAMNDVSHGIAYSSLMNAGNLSGEENLRNLKMGSYLYSKFSHNLKILDNSAFDSNDIDDLCKKITAVHNENHYDMVIIDQYSIIKESDEVSERIATTLRNLARELNLSIIILAQMNKVSQRESMNEHGVVDVNKISGIALKGASALEQQASNVTFILPSGKHKCQYGIEGSVVSIVNKKGRYGSGKQISMLFLSEYNLFVDIDEVDTIKSNNMVQEVFIDEKI